MYKEPKLILSKKVRGQPMVTIWINLVVLQCLVFYTNDIDHLGMVAILDMWPWSFEQCFVPPSQGGSTWNLTLTGSVVSEQKMFENVEDNKIWVTLDYSKFQWHQPFDFKKSVDDGRDRGLPIL